MERIMKESKKERICPNCGWDMASETLTENLPEEYSHCPNCLCGVHDKDRSGEECGGIMEPVGVWVRTDDEWEIIQRCRLCGEMRTVPMSECDSPIKVLSIASKPLSSPPFPFERIEELTRRMGGQGEIRTRRNMNNEER